MNTLPLIAAGLVGIIALSLILIRRSTENKREKQRKKAASLGFRPLESPPLQLETKINQLRQQDGGNRLQLREVYHRAGFDQDLYLVDVKDVSDDQGAWFGPETLVVLSPNLALPRFALMSLPEMEQYPAVDDLARPMLEKVFQWAARALGLQRITFPSIPDFDTQYAVFGENEHAVRQLFTNSLTSYLLGLEVPVVLEGDSDLFAITLSYTNPRDRADHLQTLYRETQDLSRILKSGV